MKKATIALLLICGAVFAQQKGSFTDTRDKKTYKTVKIGEQTWMAENLNYSVESSKCYEDDESNCQKYGRLYDWGTAVKACPKGWHLPKNEEWYKLMVSAGGDEVAGMHLKAKEGWVENGNGTDNYGFSALPGGCLPDGCGGSYDNTVGRHGIWWSATNYSYDSEGRYEFYHYTNMDLSRRTYFGDSEISSSNLLSVRCLKN